MELYHNQVTRGQGAWSLRMFHRSWGIMLMQANIKAPCIVLDFPTLDRFVEELQKKQYDLIGISSIIPNQGKVRHMCQLIRKYQPQAKIAVGGHIANIPGLEGLVGCDFAVKGEGVRWLRGYVGEETRMPINSPIIASAINPRCAGIDLKSEIAATIIPTVGCPLGCNFCSTSAMFGGKGKSEKFYADGKEMFYVMNQISEQLGVNSFFVMDENFLLHRKRNMELLALMEKHNKSWVLYVFSSANAIANYSNDELLRLGVSWIWLGLEGKDSRYQKLADTDAFKLVWRLQSIGIHVLGSSIIASEKHTAENIMEVIGHAAAYDTDFHQMMLYTPIPGTELHAEILAQGLMKDESMYDPKEIHGQSILNYNHPGFNDEQTAWAMIEAFKKDFEKNGPSIVRIVRTALLGWKVNRDCTDVRVLTRLKREWASLSWRYSALAGAAVLYFKDDSVLGPKMRALLSQLIAEFGWRARVAAFLGGRYLLRKIRQEECFIDAGGTYEPPTFYEGNAAAVAEDPNIPLCRYVAPYG